MAVWSIINKDDIEGASRIDAEYYQPEYVEAYQKLSNLNVLPLSSFCSFIKKGIFDLSPDNYRDQGVPFTRTTEIKKEIADFDCAVCIPEEVHKANKKTELRSGDIVFTKIGANIGDSSILPTLYKRYNFSQNVAGAKIKQSEIEPHYLAAYLSSQYGKFQLRRVQMLSGQGKLELVDIRNMLIFNAEEDKQKEVSGIYKKAEKLILASKNLYLQAEEILLQELGLDDLDLKNNLFYITTLKDVKNSRRLDPEFFIPKYDDLLEHINNYKNGSCSILDIAKHVITNFDPLNEGEYFRYVELSNIQSSLGVISAAQEILSNEAPSRARRKLKTDDVVVSSVKGSLNKVAVITKIYNDAFASNGFFQFRPKINPYYFLVLVKSKLVNLQLFRLATGAILSAVPKELLGSVKVPILNDDFQRKIAKIVQESQIKNEEAKQLLEQAKRKVEEMIEREAGNK